MGVNLSKLGKIDKKWLYLLSIVFIIIPIVKPLGLPIEITQPTKDFYDTIKELPAGSVVVWEEGGIPGQYDLNRPSMVIALTVLFSSPFKLIIFSDSGDGPILIEDTLRRVNPEKDFGKKMYEDYVVFGFAPGGESASASFATDMRKTFATDMYGTPIDDIPMMKNINSAKDVDLIIQLVVGGYRPDWVIRQWVTPYGTKYIAMCQTGTLPGLVVYYPEQVKGYLGGTLGAAELEILTGNPGEGVAASDAKNLGLFPMLLFIIFGNIAYLNKRFGEKGENI